MITKEILNYLLYKLYVNLYNNYDTIIYKDNNKKKYIYKQKVTHK